MLKSAIPVTPNPPNRKSWGQTIRLLWRQSKGLAVLLLATLCLSGCVRYDVGVTFESQTQGEIVQQIRLSQRLTNFSPETVQEWLESIDRRARSLHGKIKPINDQELIVRIPFHNGAELEKKFNQFFNPTTRDTDPLTTTSTTDLPQVGAHLHLKQNNALLALRNRMSVDLDLRGLGKISNSNDPVEIDTESLFEIDFALNTPWGATSITGTGTQRQTEYLNPHGVWKLKPGQMNHFEAVFWVPSPIGIGAVGIVLLMVIGHFLKHRILPALGWEQQARRPKTVSVKS